jgi:uncharacterized protein (DUF362 family)
VSILHADSYARSLEERLTDGLRLFGLNLRGKTVLLKPNLVEYIPGAEVNTNPLLVGAAAGAFLALGAKTVVVAEGPGNQRDTYLVFAQTGFESQLRGRKLSFVDLNRDDVRQVKVTTPFTGLGSLWIPQSILAADFVVSMPKVKTHHWAGVTLGLKNMFGAIPGSVYGWPKNILHWKGIDRSILDINSTILAHFVIADGIVAMEGNGPLQGTARDLGRIVMSDDPVAADFTCARLMGFDPYRISHLAQAAQFLGNGDVERIDQLGEKLPRTVRPFSVLPEFAHLIAGATS